MESTVSCRCGCVPSNMLSLFQMSELREKKKAQDKKHRKALGLLIEKQCVSNSDCDGTLVCRSLDIHGQSLASCHLFFDQFLKLTDSLTSLHLDHNLLNFIPNGILKSLPLLLNLSLHNNQLETLPSEIGILTHLEHLRLDCNALTSLPVELKYCSSLQSLHLTGNPLLNHLPADLFTNMSRLHHVLVDQCPLLCSLPVSLQYCSALAFVVADDSCLEPPRDVLAAGHDAIWQYFHSDPCPPRSMSSEVSTRKIISVGVEHIHQQNSSAVLNTDSHCMHRDNALRYLELKRSARMTDTNRCERCWHMPAICICDILPRVALNDNIELVVYMDSKEVFNAGDDAKLLSIVCPEQTKRFIYAAEDKELVDYVTSQLDFNPSNRAVVLFPSSRATSCDDYIAMWRQNHAQEQETRGVFTGVLTDGDSERPVKSSEKYPPSDLDESSGVLTTPRKLMIIVVDAVWRHARRMAQRLHLLLPAATHVQLTPEQFSVYARKQSQPDRICTVEATALFLSHIGGADAVACDQLVKCVRINNDALRPPPPALTELSLDTKKSSEKDKGSSTLYMKESNATHPCWYYGKVFHHTHGELMTKQPKVPKQKRRYL